LQKAFFAADGHRVDTTSDEIGYYYLPSENLEKSKAGRPENVRPKIQEIRI